MEETKNIDYWQEEIDKNKNNSEELYIIAFKLLNFAAKRSLEFKLKAKGG